MNYAEMNKNNVPPNLLLQEKVILTDCDGVLVDWLYSFHSWMNTVHSKYAVVTGTYDMEIAYDMDKSRMKEYVRAYNASASVAYMSPLRDAVKYVKKLHEEHGYVFRCITSLSLDASAWKARMFNLEQLFGKTAFELLVCLDTGADKDEALEPYRNTNCYWIEDKVQNADLGSNLGLNSLLIGHDFNADYTGDVPRVQNWKEIYNIITG